MALSAESRGRNWPDTRLIWIAPASLPAARLTVAISAAETVRSAVTTTRPVVVFTYHAMPSTPDRCTALLAADSWSARDRCAGGAAVAKDGKANAEAARTPMVAAS